MAPGVGTRGRGGWASATLGGVLQRVQLLPVGDGVDADGGETRGQVQAELAGGQDGHVQHGVQEAHPAVVPLQAAPVPCGKRDVGSAGPRPGCLCGPRTPTITPLPPGPGPRQQEGPPRPHLRGRSRGRAGRRARSHSPAAADPCTRRPGSGGTQPWSPRGPRRPGCQRAWGQGSPTGTPSLGGAGCSRMA